MYNTPCGIVLALHVNIVPNLSQVIEFRHLVRPAFLPVIPFLDHLDISLLRVIIREGVNRVILAVIGAYEVKEVAKLHYLGCGRDPRPFAYTAVLPEQLLPCRLARVINRNRIEHVPCAVISCPEIEI